MTPEPKVVATLWISEITFPWSSAAHRYTVSPSGLRPGAPGRVRRGHEPAPALQRRRDPPRGLAPVEAAEPVAADLLQRRRQLRVAKGHPALDRGQEAGGLGVGEQPVSVRGQLLGDLLGDDPT